MKKFFSLISIAILALGIVSCNKNKVDYNYSIELSGVYDEAEKSPAITVNLSEENIPFIIDFLDSEVAAGAKEADLFAAITQRYGSALTELTQSKSGVYYFRDAVFVPGKTYTFVAFVIDLTTLQPASSMATTSVTIPAKSTNQIEMSYDPYANDSVITVKTSNNAPYYITILADDVYAEYIESGQTTVAEFVAYSMKQDMDASKEAFPERSFTEIFEKYRYVGDMEFNFIDEFGDDFMKGRYHALAAGVEMVESVADFSIQLTTEGFEYAFELSKDYITPAEKRANMQGKNMPFKRIQKRNVKIDLIKMHTPTRK